MATGEDLVLAVQEIVQDPSYTTTEILPLINEGLQMLAAEKLLPPLDSRATVNTVTTGNVADLPTDYGQGIYYADDAGRELKVYESWTDMAREYTDLTLSGDVKGVAVVGDTLMYLPIPTAATPLTIYYYRTPTTLIESAEPDGFNRQTRPYGEAALKYYAAFRLYDIIEDGIEGAKVNTIRWERRYQEMVSKLKIVTNRGVSRPTEARNIIW